MADEKVTEGNVSRPPAAPSAGPLQPDEMGGLVFSYRLVQPDSPPPSPTTTPLAASPPSSSPKRILQLSPTARAALVYSVRLAKPEQRG